MAAAVDHVSENAAAGTLVPVFLCSIPKLTLSDTDSDSHHWILPSPKKSNHLPSFTSSLSCTCWQNAAACCLWSIRIPQAPRWHPNEMPLPGSEML